MSRFRFFRDRPWAILAVVAWMGIIFTFSSFPGAAGKYEMPLSLYLERKGAHVFEFFVLSALSWNMFRMFFPKERSVFLVSVSSAFSLLYAFSDEAHQLFVPFREGKLSDVGIDSIGIALFVLASAIRTRFRKDSES